MASFSYEGAFDLDEVLSMDLSFPQNSTPIISPLTNNIDSVTERILTFPIAVTSDDAVCSVCTEEFDLPRLAGRKMPCGHVYHTHCIATWLSVRDSCPLCRVMVVDQKSANKKSTC